MSILNNEKMISVINDYLENVGLERIAIDGDLIGQLEDSLIFISFVIELEETFGVEFDDRALEPERFKTIKSLIPAIVEMLSEKNNYNCEE